MLQKREEFCLLANSSSLSDAFEIFEHFFKLLICKCSADCKDCKSFLEENMQSDIEKILLILIKFWMVKRK